jgi:hypothetical protein
MAVGQKTSPKGFAIYLLPQNIKTNRLKNLDLKKLKPTGTLVITESDIQYYQKETHEFRVDNLAAGRIKKINDQGTARGFAVFVGDQAIYTGAFWKSIFSQSFDGIIINTFKAVGNRPYSWQSEYPILTLETGYPSPSYFKGTDLRSAPKIFKALEEAGKLYEKAELIVKCKKIKATMKRRASHIFTFDVVGVAKGEFKEKEIEFELYDYQLLPELEYNEPIYSGKEVNFNQNQEIVLEISQQVGKEKPGWFLREYRKK